MCIRDRREVQPVGHACGSQRQTFARASALAEIPYEVDMSGSLTSAWLAQTTSSRSFFSANSGGEKECGVGRGW
eukprot:1708416-Rhodomonas_salina.1